MSVIFVNPYRLGATYDTDAQAYITAVETADGQALETAVKDALDAFVVGCKADGIWAAIKASCILAGARTRLGALTPLVGTAPSSVNFVDGDYDRKMGLIGDGSTKYLDSNRNNNADPQNAKHVSVYVSVARTGTGFAIIGTEDGTVNGSSQISHASGNYTFRLNSSAISGNIAGTTGLIGANRVSSTGFTTRVGGLNTSVTAASQAGSNRSINIYRRSVNSSNTYVNARLSFYSIGESIDLALLDTRVTTLMTALAAAIP